MSMFVVSVILSVVAIASIAWTSWARRKAHAHYKYNLAVAHELKILAEAMDKANAAQQQIKPSDLPDGPPDLSSPAMLATLVTVLVSRLGTVRLGLADFARVDDDAAVSVYVDNDTQEILLSLDDSLASNSSAEDDLYRTLGSFTKPDDTTFH